MPSGIVLIDEALENGEIDEETALIYKIFHAFVVDRSSAAYAGGFGTGDFRTHITKKAGYLYESLSPEARVTIGPFLVPPIYKGSWWDLRRRETTKWWQLYLEEENTLNKSTEEEVLPCVPGMNCDIIQPGFMGPDLLTTAGVLIHEMMHTFQYAYLIYHLTTLVAIAITHICGHFFLPKNIIPD